MKSLQRFLLGDPGSGTYFQYQNWDFNAAGTAFEKQTGKDISSRWKRIWPNQ